MTDSSLRRSVCSSRMTGQAIAGALPGSAGSRGAGVDPSPPLGAVRLHELHDGTSSAATFGPAADPHRRLVLHRGRPRNGGFGDITPESEAARVVLIVQMLGDLAILGVGIRSLANSLTASSCAATGLLTTPRKRLRARGQLRRRASGLAQGREPGRPDAALVSMPTSLGIPRPRDLQAHHPSQ
jgi:hypothetical protein